MTQTQRTLLSINQSLAMHRDVWKAVARRIASDKHLPVNEHAIYGALCGHLSPILLASDKRSSHGFSFYHTTSPSPHDSLSSSQHKSTPMKTCLFSNTTFNNACQQSHIILSLYKRIPQYIGRFSFKSTAGMISSGSARKFSLGGRPSAGWSEMWRGFTKCNQSEEVSMVNCYV